MGAVFYNLGVLYDIDPIYALAFFSQEYSMYNQVVGTFKKNNSGYNGYVSRANIAGISTELVVYVAKETQMVHIVNIIPLLKELRVFIDI
jgi:hypothetical protein